MVASVGLAHCDVLEITISDGLGTTHRARQDPVPPTLAVPFGVVRHDGDVHGLEVLLLFVPRGPSDVDATLAITNLAFPDWPEQPVWKNPSHSKFVTASELVFVRVPPNPLSRTFRQIEF